MERDVVREEGQAHSAPSLPTALGTQHRSSQFPAASML